MADKNEIEKKNITVFGEETEFDGVLEFNDRLVITGKFSGKINAPEVFKLTLDDNNNVENIEVIDIDYSEVE